MLIQEEKFKENLISRLNSIRADWIDGDLDTQRKKKADIVHHKLKIAIEIKDDKKYKGFDDSKSFESLGEDLTEMNKHFMDDAKSANQKFEFYPGYKTILLIRTEYPVDFFADVLRYAIEGPKTLHINKSTLRVVRVTRTRKYSDYALKNVGGFLIFSGDGYYFLNEVSDSARKLAKEEAENIFGMKFKEPPKI